MVRLAVKAGTERKRSMNVSTSRDSRALRGQTSALLLAGDRHGLAVLWCCWGMLAPASTASAGPLPAPAQQATPQLPAALLQMLLPAAAPSCCSLQQTPLLSPDCSTPYLISVGTSTRRPSRSMRNSSCASAPPSACCGRSANCALNSRACGWEEWEGRSRVAGGWVSCNVLVGKSSGLPSVV